MISASTAALLIAVSLPIALIPGPSVAFILTTTLRSGRGGGLAAVAGIELGYVLHVVGAALGISALVAASATAFTVVKVAGVLYLLWLAFRALGSRREGTLEQPTAQDMDPTVRRSLTRGFMVGALNPKTAMFFVAFLPQFVSPGAGPIWLQLTLLGFLFILVMTVPDTMWALAGAALRRHLPRLKLRALDRISGCVYILMAAAASTVRRATP